MLIKGGEPLFRSKDFMLDKLLEVLGHLGSFFLMSLEIING